MVLTQFCYSQFEYLQTKYFQRRAPCQKFILYFTLLLDLFTCFYSEMQNIYLKIVCSYVILQMILGFYFCKCIFIGCFVSPVLLYARYVLFFFYSQQQIQCHEQQIIQALKNPRIIIVIFLLVIFQFKGIQQAACQKMPQDKYPMFHHGFFACLSKLFFRIKYVQTQKYSTGTKIYSCKMYTSFQNYAIILVVSFLTQITISWLKKKKKYGSYDIFKAIRCQQF
eukprot:TRINITY_DN10332_c0_g2_i1.p2 TRINITY_DN10332_c0_g2~~TRINITY_DN10332_c0_g2_i1.p2  ORF type:complete len:224 (+),score=-17.54 TRINITY_DN10332_c0_g2_i1:952-1623(+)